MQIQFDRTNGIYTPRRTGSVALPGSGGCAAPPQFVATGQSADCPPGRTEMRTFLGIRQAQVPAGASVPIDIKTLQVFRAESLKITSQGGVYFLIENIMLGNTPVLPATTMGIRANLLSEVSTDVCLRWPDIRPDLPGTITVRNTDANPQDFEAMFLGWAMA